VNKVNKTDFIKVLFIIDLKHKKRQTNVSNIYIPLCNMLSKFSLQHIFSKTFVTKQHLLVTAWVPW